MQQHDSTVHEEKKLNKLYPWPSDLGKIVQTHTIQDDHFEFKFVSASDISRIISSLKNTKALGVDNISTEVLKKGIVNLAGPIARLCNTSMATGIVPDLFKKAIIHPVYKA